MGFSTVNYIEPKQSTYKSIDLTYKCKGKEIKKKFNTGNIVIDHYDYMKFLSEQDTEFYQENPFISGSSSWDHFFMDGDKYRESYFNPDTGEFIDWRKAFHDGDWQLYNDVCKDKYPKVIHLPCHKSFNKVKEYYKRKKNEISI